MITIIFIKLLIIKLPTSSFLTHEKVQFSLKVLQGPKNSFASVILDEKNIRRQLIKKCRCKSANHTMNLKIKSNCTNLALRSSFPVVSFLLRTKGNLLLTTIMLPLEEKLPGSVDMLPI